MVFSASIRRSFILLLVCAVSAVAGPGRADTCSYTYDCRGSQQCAAMMGGNSGTRTASGTMSIYTVAGDANSLRTVPVNLENCRLALRVMSAGSVTSDCTCASGDAPAATASNGFQLKSTGSATGDMVNDAAQLWILQNIKNPYTMTFAQNFTQSFLTSYIQGQKQREAIEANIRQQQEIQAEQAREAEQRRLDALFARLNSELKLSGINSQLAIKTGGDPTQLAMKLSSGSDSLAFKFGGMPETPAAAPPPGPPSEIGGLKLKIGDQPSAPGAAPSAATSTAGTDPAPSMGIPGLPGIYLNSIPPEKSPQVAAAALSMDGPQRELAEDAALQAAQKNPALTAPSQDPFVQDLQQQQQEYADALKAQQAALDKAAEAQGHVQADQTALDYANGMAQSPGATEQQSQALAQLQAAASGDEEMAMNARAGFDTAGAEASIKREQAAISLAVLSPSEPAADEDLRDAVSGSAVTQAAGSTPFFGAKTAQPPAAAPTPTPTAPRPAPAPQPATLPPAGDGLPLASPGAKPQIFTPVEQPGGKPAFAFESVQQCLGQTASASQPNPSLEQLKQQLDSTYRAYDQLLKSMEEQSEEWKEWKKKWQQAGRDSVYHLVDNIGERQIDGAVEAAKEPIDEEAAAVKKQLDTVVGEYRDYRYAMAGTQEMSGVTRQGAVIFTPNDVQQHAMLSMADFKAKLIPLNSQRMALVSRLAELEQEKKRADLLMLAMKQGRDLMTRQLDARGKEAAPESDKQKNEESPFTSMDGLLNWLQKDETGEELHEFLEVSFAAAKYTGVGVPIAEGGEFALETIDLTYDIGVEIAAFMAMRDMDKNNPKLKEAQLALQKRITRLTAEESCYYHSGPAAGAEAAR